MERAQESERGDRVGLFENHFEALLDGLLKYSLNEFCEDEVVIWECPFDVESLLLHRDFDTVHEGF